MSFTPIIPLEFDASISYIERLMILCKRLKEQGKSITEIQQYLDTLNIDELIKQEVIREFNDQENLRQLLTKKKILIIGDSYAVGETASVNYPDLLRVKGFDVTKVAEGGTGFSAVNTLGHNFKSLIDNYIGAVDFTDVYFIGGTNDVYTNDVITTLNNAILSTVATAKNKFTFANIHIGFLSQINRAGGSVGEGLPYQYIATQYTYKNACYQANACYIDNLEFVLKRKSFINTTDGVHPTNAGQYAIANALTSYIINGNISATQVVQIPKIDMTNTPFLNPPQLAINFTQNNDITTVNTVIDWTGVVDSIQFTFDGVYSHCFYLGSPNDSTIFGLSTGKSGITDASQFLTSASIPVVISNDNNESFNVTGSLFFANGGMFLKVMLLDNKSTFKTMKVQQLNIPAFSVTINSLFC